MPPAPTDLGNALTIDEPFDFATMTGLAPGDGQAPPERGLLLHHAMALVAEAEQILAAQRDRIRQLERLCMTDELTGLYNRRGFNDFFQKALAAARRTPDRAGVLVLLDLDRFKTINDRYGHLAGDTILRHVAKSLISQTREMDTIARLGGDEFAILMPSCAFADGCTRATALQRLLEDNPLEWDGEDLSINASIGIAPFKGNEVATDVIADADVRLYADKRQS